VVAQGAALSMTNKKNILIVDDELINLNILKEILRKEYEIKVFESGDECLAYLKTIQDAGQDTEQNFPDLILMDVKMPGTNGLECCKQIKQNSLSADIPVVFLSALIQPEDRIAGYEAGGDDYILKPFDDDELKMKLRLVLENRSKFKNKSNDYQEALSTAMTAMTNASEIGIILRFFHEIFSATDIESVTQSLLSVVNSYGLQATLAINIDSPDALVYSSIGVVKPLEVSLIKELRGRERIFHFGKRTLISMGCVSLLILNMPTENEELYGRLKDHLAMITEGLQSRIDAIFVEQERNKQRENLLSLITMIQQIIASIEKSQEEHQQEHAALMNDLVDKVEGSFVYLGLTDEQEKTFTSLIRDTETKATVLFDKGSELQEKFNKIKMMLEID